LKYIFGILLLATALFSSTDWQTNYNTALKMAQEENKRVYMLIVSDDCRWCNKFERTTLKDKKILQKLNEKYVLLHLIREWDNIPKKFKTTPIPRHYFLTSQGEIIFPVVGYRDIDTFKEFLNNADERYKRLVK